MTHRIATAVLFAFALAGCATTGTNHGDGNYAGVYDGGYYVAAQDGYGDYYYDRPQVVYAYDPWYSDPFGFYGSPWGFGYGPWYYGYGSPWYWHHPPGWHHPWLAAHDFRLAEPAANPRSQNRAPRHEFQHPRP